MLSYAPIVNKKMENLWLSIYVYLRGTCTKNKGCKKINK